MRTLKILSALLLLSPLAVVACGCHSTDKDSGESATETESDSKVESGESESETPAASTFLQKATLEPADHPDQARAVALVEEHTGQKYKRAVPVYVFSAEDLKAEVESWGAHSQPENIMGFYTTRTRAMYVSPEVAGDNRQFGLRVHELVHGLQDQLYGLAELREGLTTSDQHHAMTTLIEGQATQVMIDALKDEQPHVKFIAMAKQPRRGPGDAEAWTRVVYYGYGARFIQHLQAQGGSEAVHKAYSNPPISSEQVMHPEKYDTQRDDPVKITLNTAKLQKSLGEGFKVSEQDTLGEFGLIQSMCAYPDLHEKLLSLAAGWDGDAIVRFSPGDAQHQYVAGRNYAIATKWDSIEEAKEFADALRSVKDSPFYLVQEKGTRVNAISATTHSLTAGQVDAIAGCLANAKLEE